MLKEHIHITMRYIYIYILACIRATIIVLKDEKRTHTSDPRTMPMIEASLIS